MDQAPVTQTMTRTARRRFLSALSSLAMLGGLVGGYGAFAALAGRFLYPVRSGSKNWLFVAPVHRLKQGDNLRYHAPSGAIINITRQGAAGSAGDFIALSTTCPHLGCQVYWQAQPQRYFCPCHNGVFDASGRGTSGPPGEAGQTLPHYRLKLERGLLFIDVSGVSAA